MKEMIKIIPKGACPNCASKQFIVSELQHNLFLTNKDGEIIDSSEICYNTEGICIKCGKKYEMIPTHEGFIPATKLRKILYDYTSHNINDNENIIPLIENPMMIKK